MNKAQLPLFISYSAAALGCAALRRTMLKHSAVWMVQVINKAQLPVHTQQVSKGSLTVL